MPRRRKIGFEVERHVGDALVDQAQVDRQFRRHEGRERGERERLVAQGLFPDTAAMAVKRALRRDHDDTQAEGRGFPGVGHGGGVARR